MSYALGIDLGTSSIKVAIVDGEKCVARASAPASEVPIISVHPGWAEQSPDSWWQHVCEAVLALPAAQRSQVESIGITYQMHGLVLLDSNAEPLRPAIIWCDSRAVEIGEHAFTRLGMEYCSRHTLNSPGNFTASKLAWVRENEPSIYAQTKWAMLPGDYLVMKMTEEASTTRTGLSEMAAWDFMSNSIASPVLDELGLNRSLIPPESGCFESTGTLTARAASELGLRLGTRVTYRAGDQPNNAFALGVMHPGEVAANAGTSGVVYAVSDEATCDESFRVNSFLHVNHISDLKRIGKLMCLNGCGAMVRWMRDLLFGSDAGYEQFDACASRGKSGEVLVYPFGNGAERILRNENVGASFNGVDFARHGREDLCRGALEGVSFAMAYGLSLCDLRPTEIKAGHANLFKNPLFTQTFADLCACPVTLCEADGAIGAAFGALNLVPAPTVLERIEPNLNPELESTFSRWVSGLGR